MICSLLGGMVDALDLKSSSVKSIGSSPVAGIVLMCMILTESNNSFCSLSSGCSLAV